MKKNLLAKVTTNERKSSEDKLCFDRALLIIFLCFLRRWNKNTQWYYIQLTSEIFSRYQPASHKQQSCEPVNQYYLTVLQLLCKELKFSSETEEQNKNNIITDALNINEQTFPFIRQRLLENKSLTLEEIRLLTLLSWSYTLAWYTFVSIRSTNEQVDCIYFLKRTVSTPFEKLNVDFKGHMPLQIYRSITRVGTS